MIAIGSPGRSSSRSKPSTSGMNPLMASSPAGDGRPGPECERVRHHGALREASDHGPLPRHADILGEGLEPCGQHPEGLHERVPVRESDALDDVPVMAARRQGERPARSCAHQAALGVELVEQREQVRLVDTAAVQQHERTGRLRRAGGPAAAVRRSSVAPRRSRTTAPTCSPAPRLRADRAPARSRGGSRRRATSRRSSSSAGSAPTTRQSR